MTMIVQQDEVDDILEKQDGMVKRERDPNLCRHNAMSKCQNCLPIDPFDEEYLHKKDIKHMSFHAYLRKLTGGGGGGSSKAKSSLNRYPLENTSCRIKQGCTNHRPWPHGVCDKCRPAEVTLMRQRYRHVDNISFENDVLVTRFLDYWRSSGRQRIGFLFGYYEVADVPLGIKATVAAIYEPPQTSTADSVELLDDPKSDIVDQLAAQLGLKRIGWIFTDLVADEHNRRLMKCTRNADSYLLSAEECITAGHFQSKHPNATKYCMDKYFGSKFVTVIVAGDADQKVQLFGYQVSNQCAALVADNCLVPTIDAPELAYVRDSTSEQYVPTVNYMAKDKYNNDVRKVGQPLPVEYLIVDVPAGMPIEQKFTFLNHTGKGQKQFPIENRSEIGELQDVTTVSEYCKSLSNKSIMDMACDFHFLFYLINNDAVCFKLDEIKGLCDSVKRKDRNAAAIWAEQCAHWATFMQIMTGGDHVHDTPAASGVSPKRDGGWPCTHCTFVNDKNSHDCEVCGLPKQ